jgi:hypothetical protein
MKPPVFIRALNFLISPMRLWSRRARLVAGAVLVAVSAVLIFTIVAHMEPLFSVSDAFFYLSIARGDTAHVMQPWASRQLGALVVTALAHVLHCSVEDGFVVEGVVSLLFTLGAVYWLMLRTAAPRWMLIAVAVLPSWIPLVQYLALPDLWYAALLAVVFLLLARGQFMAAAVMMFPLMLSRESTSLTLLCFLAAGWRRIHWRQGVAAVVSAAAGSAVILHLTADSPSNIEHLPETIYLLAKAPWNFVRNVVGLTPWSNVYPFLCRVPVWSMPFHYKDVQRVGICGFSWGQQLVAVQVVLTSFGLLPLLLGFLWWRHRRVAGRSVLLRFSLIYGGACLVLAPVLGAGFQHLAGYAWPLFVVALPLLFDEFRQQQSDGALRRRQVLGSVAFFLLHLAACGASYWLGLLPQIVVGLGLWVAGFVALRAWWGRAGAEDRQPGSQLAFTP